MGKFIRTPRRGSWRVAGLLVFLVAICASDCLAQVRVDITFKRRVYLSYEPIIANVTIENFSGQDLELSDTGDKRWFGFEIEMPGGRLIPPSNPNYSIPPIHVPSGQSLTRAINLTPLYPLSEYGTYMIRASVYVQAAGRYFSSAPERIEITNGRTLWEQKVGVAEGPDAGNLRAVSLIQFKHPQSIALYLRIEDPDEGIIYCTHQLGRTVNLGSPDVMLDASNNIHVLQLAAPKMYLYSHVNLDGRMVERKVYSTTKTRPSLHRTPEGTVGVVGGAFVDPNAPKPDVPPATVADRPVPLPTPPSKKKP